jgi:hypothetical protein
MGLFDFLKRKKTAEVPADKPLTDKKATIQETPDEEKSASRAALSLQDETPADQKLFDFFLKYGEYVIASISMMLKGNNSPIAAYENSEGNISGYLFFAEDMSFNFSVAEVIEKMETEFKNRLLKNSIKSYCIFYHSGFNFDNNHAVIEDIRKFKAISIKYKSVQGFDDYAALPYFRLGGDITYKGINGFSRDQNKQILSIQIDPNKDYFQERVEIKPEINENEFGVKIKKVNNGSVGDMWGGVFGFNNPGKTQITMEYMAVVFSNLAKFTGAGITIYEAVYEDVIFRGITKIGKPDRTFFPVVKNNAFIDVENKLIAEWVNVGSLEAVIDGGGRDTFGVTYFATDYARKNKIYQTEKKLYVSFSGILYVLDEQKNDEQQTGDAILSPDFVCYFPHKDLGQFGCYEFIGMLVNYKEMNIGEKGSTPGYILTIKLINNDEIEDFFTIPMFVNKDNMRISELENGMKLSGLFQLLGEIHD